MTPQPALLPVEAVIAEGHLVPNDDLTLSFTVRGKVAEILVEEGDMVREGDVLIRLADREQAEAALAAAHLELITAQQAYDDLLRTEGLGSRGCLAGLIWMHKSCAPKPNASGKT